MLNLRGLGLRQDARIQSNMNHIKVVLHDWDDTITASFLTYSGWYDEFAKYFGLKPPNLEVVKQNWGKTIFDIISSVWLDVDHKSAVDLFKKFVPSKAYDPPIFFGIKSTIKKLHEDGYVLGVLTLGTKAHSEKMYVKHFGKPLAFHHFLMAQEDIKHHKPDPRFFDNALKILNKAGVKESQTIYVGDHLLDMNVCRNRGIRFIAVTTGLTSKETFLREGVPESDILSSFRLIYKVL